jgi:hypothetical protein
MAMVESQTKLSWEKLAIAEPKHEFTYSTVLRAKVPGGWILTVFYTSGHQDGGVATTFVPDPEHAWDGGSLP